MTHLPHAMINGPIPLHKALPVLWHTPPARKLCCPPFAARLANRATYRCRRSRRAIRQAIFTLFVKVAIEQEVESEHIALESVQGAGVDCL